MLIEWMAYAALLASIVYLGAMAAERVVAIWNGGQRFVWIVSLLIATVVPIVLATRVSPPTIRPPVALAPVASEGRRVFVALQPTTQPIGRVVRARAERALAAADPYLQRGWLLASAVCLVLFVRAAIGVRRQRSRWRPVELDGSRVLVAPNVGPAVIGALRPDVVIPEWALSLDRQARALMLRHEREHIRARDPLMLALAGAAVALFPWNPALWMLARRLRLAIEIDCDRRVLGESSQLHEYGLLLLTVGARNSASLPFATSLAERRPFLERRIRAMTSARPRNPLSVSLACLAVAVVASTAAVRAPRPQPFVVQQGPTPVVAPVAVAVVAPQVESVPVVAPSPSPTPIARPVVASAPIAAPVVAPAPFSNATPARARGGEPIPDAVIRALIARYYPGVLSGDSNVNAISFVFDANGNYVLSTADYQPPVAEKIALLKSTNANADIDRKQVLEEKLAYMRADGAGAPSQVLLKARADTEQVLIATLKQNVSLEEKRAIEARYTNLVADTISVLTNIMPGKTALSDLVDPKTIESVEVRKFPEGRMARMPIGVIIVQLKPAGE